MYSHIQVAEWSCNTWLASGGHHTTCMEHCQQVEAAVTDNCSAPRAHDNSPSCISCDLGHVFMGFEISSYVILSSRKL